MRCHSEDLIHASVENHGPVKPTLRDKSNRRERKGEGTDKFQGTMKIVGLVGGENTEGYVVASS